MNFNIENFYHEKEKSILKEISDRWEKLDYFLFQNKNQKYKVVKLKKRKLITKFGIINYQRRIYKYYNIELKKWIYTSLLDEYLGIAKFKRIHKDLYNHIINFLGDGKRYRDIKDTIPKTNISLMTISRIFQNYTLKDKKIEKIKVDDNEIIYINLDDCFQHVKNKNNKKELFKIRVISFNLGLDFTSKYKNRLKDKKINFIYNEKEVKGSNLYFNENKTVNFIWKKLNEYYEFENAKIVIGGDGALWIKNIAKWFGASYVLDRWHALKLLWTEYKPNIGKRKLKLVRDKYLNYMQAKEYFLNGEYDQLINFLEKTNATKTTLSIFKSNKDGIITQNKNWNIGVSAESDVFHFIKSLKGNGSKIYNYKTYFNMINYKTAKFNNMIAN